MLYIDFGLTHVQPIHDIDFSFFCLMINVWKELTEWKPKIMFWLNRPFDISMHLNVI